MRIVLSLSALALMLGATGPASAQSGAAEPSPAQVKVAAEAFDKGREAYKAEEYIDAAEQFEKADDNAPSSAAIELAIRARDKAGELDRAATLLALALKRHPDDANLQKLSTDILRRAGEKLFELSASCDQPCDLTVGGKITHGAPDTQRTLYVAPGALTVRAGWSDNRSDSKQVQAEAGSKGEMAFVAPTTAGAAGMAKEPTEQASPEPVAGDPARDEGPAKKSSGLPPALFFVGAGLTVVAGGITIWSGIDTLNNPGTDAVKKACDSDAPNCNELYEQGRSNQNRTNVLIGVTAGLGAVTVLIGALATDWSGGKSSPAPQASAKLQRPSLDVAPWASLEGGGLQAFGRF